MVDKFGLSDIEDIFAQPREEAKEILSKLRKCGAIKRFYNHYMKTPQFISYLKERSKKYNNGEGDVLL